MRSSRVLICLAAVLFCVPAAGKGGKSAEPDLRRPGMPSDGIRTVLPDGRGSVTAYRSGPTAACGDVRVTVRSLARLRSAPLQEEDSSVLISYEIASPSKDLSLLSSEAVSESGHRLWKFSYGSWPYNGICYDQFALGPGTVSSLRELTVRVSAADRPRHGPYALSRLQRPFWLVGSTAFVMLDLSTVEVDDAYTGKPNCGDDLPDSLAYLAQWPIGGTRLVAAVYLAGVGGGRYASLADIVVEDSHGRRVTFCGEPWYRVWTDVDVGRYEFRMPAINDTTGQWYNPWPEAYYGLQFASGFVRWPEPTRGMPDGQSGKRVVRIDPHGPAKAAGLALGDLVLEVGRTPITASIAYWYVPGGPVPVTVVRNGKKMRFQITPVPDPVFRSVIENRSAARDRLFRFYPALDVPRDAKGNVIGDDTMLPLARLYCEGFVSDQPVPADFRPASVTFYFPSQGPEGRDSTNMKLRVTSVPIPDP